MTTSQNTTPDDAPPQKPMNKWLNVVVSALSFALGAALVSKLFGNKGRGLHEHIGSMGVMGGFVGYEQGSGQEKLYASQLRNHELSKELKALKSSSHTHRIEEYKKDCPACQR